MQVTHGFPWYKWTMKSQWRWLCGALLLLQGCRVIDNYTDPDGPRYSGSHAETPPSERGTFKLVTFNIKHGEHYEQAAEEIRASPELSDADALVLQEMYSDAVEAMARTLQLNYVYYPASLHRHGNDFGNAVLSPWAIVADAKLILPHLGPHDGGLRAAVRATLEVPGGSVVVYGVHTETPWLGPRGRLDQSRAIIADTMDQQGSVVVAGDFNTVDPGSVKATAKLYREEGFIWASEGVVGTVGGSLINFTLDHIFSRGLTAQHNGMVDTEASDHRPVWAEFSWRRR